MAIPRLRTVLGDHAHVRPLKHGDVRSDLFELEFIDFKPTHAAFKAMVREQAFDVCEMAIVTCLIARAYQKPLVLLPATMLGRFQHGFALYNAERGRVGPSDLAGRRVGIRSFTTTTGAWIRGILANDHGVDLDKVRWITFEDPHVAEYRDKTERAPNDKTIIEMLLGGELDAALGETSNDARLKPLFGDPAVAAAQWYRRHRVVPVNHLVVVSGKLARERPDIVAELYRLLKQSKAKAGEPATPDPVPFGVEANRQSLGLMIDYAAQQSLIPHRFAVEELFHRTTRDLN